MPIPKPRSDESQEDFISRCMSSDVMNEEYPEQDQRAAICYRQWRNRDKSQEANMEKKLFHIQLKEDKPGSFTARIATLNVVDSDGDITVPGAFPQGKTVLVSSYQHGSWSGQLPVGKAVIREAGDDVIAEGEFNLNTDSGKEHYEAIKFSADLQEWSYGFHATEWEMSKQDGKEVRILKKLDVFEISPVLKGAGVDTALLAIKNDSNGQTFSDQADAALAVVDSFVERAKSLADLRGKKGGHLSTASREKMLKLKSDIDSLLQIKQPADGPKAEELAQGRQVLLELLKFQNTLLGVK